VHESLAEEFSAELGKRMGALTLGRGTEEGVDVGPLVDEKSRDKVSALVDDAVEKGARVVVGGSAREGAGWFYEPTVLTDVPEDADLTREEIFGLVAYLFTNDLSRALTVSEALEFGMVGVNQGIVSNPAAPFGGVKASGVGREGGFEGIDEYLETKYVGIAL
jgi:succinate-semialdehyde dehydrogenase / glutarate-semialdehyde dehydrogenase